MNASELQLAITRESHSEFCVRKVKGRLCFGGAEWGEGAARKPAVDYRSLKLKDYVRFHLIGCSVSLERVSCCCWR